MTEPLKPCREDLVPEVKDIAGYAEREPFTLEQLASHTSGLDREPSSADGLLWRPWRLWQLWQLWKLNTGSPSLWEEKVLSGIKTASWAHEPGKKGWHYCNIGCKTRVGFSAQELWLLCLTWPPELKVARSQTPSWASPSAAPLAPTASQTA